MLTNKWLFEYIRDILQACHLGYDDYSVTDFYGVIASRDNDLTVTQDSGDEDILLELKARDRNADYR